MSGFTKIPNWLIDQVMPAVSPNAFRVIMAIYRKTIGWNCESDIISQSQFQEATGIKSRSTLANAIEEALDSGFVSRETVGQSYCYRATCPISDHDRESDMIENRSGTRSEIDQEPDRKSITPNTYKDNKDKEAAAPAHAVAAAHPAPAAPSAEHPANQPVWKNSIPETQIIPPAAPPAADPAAGLSADERKRRVWTLAQAWAERIGRPYPHHGDHVDTWLKPLHRLLIDAGWDTDRALALLQHARVTNVQAGNKGFYPDSLVPLAQTELLRAQAAGRPSAEPTAEDITRAWNLCRAAAAGRPEALAELRRCPALRAAFNAIGDAYTWRAMTANDTPFRRRDFENTYRRHYHERFATTAAL